VRSRAADLAENPGRLTWTFLLGPGWVVGWGNGLILGYLMYSSGLVRERWRGSVSSGGR
jgi:hypothetical protein